MNTVYRGRATALLFGVASVVGACSFAQAQDKPHKSLIKRHPTASAAVAGVAAHHIAKRHGHGIMHRHPVATGVAAAAVTHHMAKKK